MCKNCVLNNVTHPLIGKYVYHRRIKLNMMNLSNLNTGMTRRQWRKPRSLGKEALSWSWTGREK